MNTKEYIENSKGFHERLRSKLDDLIEILDSLNIIEQKTPGDHVAKVLHDKTKWVHDLLSDDMQRINSLMGYVPEVDSGVVRVRLQKKLPPIMINNPKLEKQLREEEQEFREKHPNAVRLGRSGYVLTEHVFVDGKWVLPEKPQSPETKEQQSDA